jgi:hypothetical protein
MGRAFFYAFLLAGLFNFACSMLLLRRLTEAGFKVSFFENSLADSQAYEGL